MCPEMGPKGVSSRRQAASSVASADRMPVVFLTAGPARTQKLQRRLQDTHTHAHTHTHTHTHTHIRTHHTQMEATVSAQSLCPCLRLNVWRSSNDGSCQFQHLSIGPSSQFVSKLCAFRHKNTAKGGLQEQRTEPELRGSRPEQAKRVSGPGAKRRSCKCQFPSLESCS